MGSVTKSSKAREQTAIIEMEDPATNKMLEGTERIYNVNQVMMYITEDKAKLCLINFVDSIKGHTEWYAPFGVFISVVITLITADFKDFIFPKHTWQAVFIIAAILSALQTIRVRINRKKTMSVEDVVREMQHAESKQPKDSSSSIVLTTPVVMKDNQYIKFISDKE